MTCGIYLLKFNGTDKVYVGQAVNIEKRYLRHLYQFSTGLGSKKMMEAYQEYGEPSLTILLECTQEELCENEQAAIEVYDAVSNGFNSIDAQQHSIVTGEAHGMSKYSNEMIEKAFFLLLDRPDLRQKEVADLVGIPEKVVNLISCGINHRWLKDKYPEQYDRLVIPKKTGPKITGKYRVLVSKEGREYVVDNIKQFAEAHGLSPSAVGALMRGERKKLRSGWTAK